MDKDKPSDEYSYGSAKHALCDIAVTFDREPVTVQFDIQPPDQAAAIEGRSTHEDVEQGTGHISILTKSIWGVERAQNVCCAQVECPSPRSLSQCSPRIDLCDFVVIKTLNLKIYANSRGLANACESGVRGE